LARNAELLSVFLITDITLSTYFLPRNLIAVFMTLEGLREKFAKLLACEYGLIVEPSTLVPRPIKLCDFRAFFPAVFHTIGKDHGMQEDDFVGWGDCDVIYGRMVDFIDPDLDYDAIGGYHGHFTVWRNNVTFRTLYRKIDVFPHLLLGNATNYLDEGPIYGAILGAVNCHSQRLMEIYSNLCDICPEEFFYRFRGQHVGHTFFEVNYPDRQIDHILYDRDGRLTVVYERGDTRQCLYCHLQKREMKVEFSAAPNGYRIREHAFTLP
jgi:hypothetical protein